VTIRMTASLAGMETAIANFEAMKRGVRGRVLRKAVRAGAAPGVRAAKNAGTFEDDTGVLRRSATSKIKTYPSGITTAIIGPRNKVVDRYSKSKNRTVRRNPNNYAHLVELGHRVAVNPATGRSQKDFVLLRRGQFALKPGKSLAVAKKTDVSPRPFMRNAFNQSRHQQLSALKDKFAAEIIAEAAKLNTNG